MIKRASGALSVVSGIALIAMVLLVAADVVMRTLFHAAVEGVTEIVSAWLMPLTVLFAMAMAERKHEHMQVLLVVDAMRGAPQRALEIVGRVIVVVMSVVMTWYSYTLAVSSATSQEAIPMGTGLLPIWPVKVAIVIAWAMLTLETVVSLFRRRRTDSDADGAPQEIEAGAHA